MLQTNLDDHTSCHTNLQPPSIPLPHVANVYAYEETGSTTKREFQIELLPCSPATPSSIKLELEDGRRPNVETTNSLVFTPTTPTISDVQSTKSQKRQKKQNESKPRTASRNNKPDSWVPFPCKITENVRIR